MSRISRMEIELEHPFIKQEVASDLEIREKNVLISLENHLLSVIQYIIVTHAVS